MNQTDNKIKFFISTSILTFIGLLNLLMVLFLQFDRYVSIEMEMCIRDRLEVIDKYGADALRLTLVTGNAPGNDMRFYWERVESSRNFANKVWNASRFIMMNLDKAEVKDVSLDKLTDADKWILSKVNTLAAEVTDNMENYDLGVAVSKIYDFIWEEFCDWYIETVSYTHLDVYKRQLLRLTDFLRRLQIRIR